MRLSSHNTHSTRQRLSIRRTRFGIMLSCQVLDSGRRTLRGCWALIGTILLLVVKVAVVEGAFHLGWSSSPRLAPTISTTSLGANVNNNNNNNNSAENRNYDRLISRRKAWETTAKTAAVGFSSSSGLLFLPVRHNNEARAADVSTPPSPTTTTTTNSLNLTVPKVRLGKSSLEVSRTIQGHWQLAGGHGRYKESEAIANMRAHAAAGITTLDTADIYGPSELIVGKFAKEEEPKNAGITVCTKFCCFKFLNVRCIIMYT
jgi:Aldo/keto reductase family